jgi:cytochrome c-type biogenesis protein CcmH/NrfF
MIYLWLLPVLMLAIFTGLLLRRVSQLEDERNFFRRVAIDSLHEKLLKVMEDEESSKRTNPQNS